MSSDKDIKKELHNNVLNSFQKEEKQFEELKAFLGTDNDYTTLGQIAETLNLRAYQFSCAICWAKDKILTEDNAKLLDDLEEKFEEVCDEVDKLTNKFKWEIIANSKRFNELD